MKSVKLKVSLIANLIAVVCLIILGVVTFIFVKQAIFHEVVNAEINYVKTAKNSIESFKARNSLALESLAKSCRRKNKISIWKNKTSIKVEILFFYKP